MKDLCLVINTISSYSDLWPMFFDALDEYLPNIKRYVFVDEGIPDEHSTTLHYEKSESFRTQFLSCITQVPEKYCIFISEDYILYDAPRLDLIERYKEVLEKNENLTFIRFAKGINNGEPRFKDYEDLYQLSPAFPYFYSQTATLWRTRDLEKIFTHSQESSIATLNYEDSFEWKATAVCREIDIQGLFCYNGEKKRGKYHYDSIVLPYIATALVKGKWNLSEYNQELTPLLKKYKIDPEIRGMH
tara:strand:+ start:2823 stop:3557 length:735 start_codon:yes stop_codon:yes gene_type:complete